MGPRLEAGTVAGLLAGWIGLRITVDAENVFQDEQHKTSSNVGLADPGCYRILVKGCLDGSWSAWFDSLAVVPDSGRGQTAISGWLADQAALHGLLNKIRNLGLVLLAVTLVEPRPCDVEGLGPAAEQAGGSPDS